MDVCLPIPILVCPESKDAHPQNNHLILDCALADCLWHRSQNRSIDSISHACAFPHPQAGSARRILYRPAICHLDILSHSPVKYPTDSACHPFTHQSISTCSSFILQKRGRLYHLAPRRLSQPRVRPGVGKNRQTHGRHLDYPAGYLLPGEDHLDPDHLQS